MRREVLISTFIFKGLYTHLLAPLMGFFYFVRERSLNQKIYPLLSLPIIGLILAIVNQDISSFIRVSQLTGILLFFNVLLYKEVDYLLISKITLFCGLLCLSYDIFNGTDLLQESIPGITLPRYKGLTREYNFSAAAYVATFIILVFHKRYRLLILPILLVVSTGSRAGMLSLVLFPIFYFAEKHQKLAITLLMLVLLYPLLVLSTFSITTQSSASSISLKEINNISSKRLAIQRDVFRILKDYPLGVGYFRDREKLRPSMKLETRPYGSLDPHNLSLQILLEFGVVGYLGFLIFILINTPKMKIVYPTTTILFVFSFLNGLHEISLYLMLSLSLMTNRLATYTLGSKT